ncbi:helix-turn-helix domain-containing protein [Rubrivirga sp. S365]|uniref:Helix-turn-helix domain-containing protein n=1 Tax=Rubrivirga litoralis TaxID=3075598 RepID=A0ABU3BTU9_9BACT|nr:MULTISPECIES: helix-turn-helix domain-containing protein [unclassified Rubrivirga]MDT0632712.1 helix-turn-helix domain-containing protein [Rubrivirga sp. F394]MDT7857822.1 helix-turn-helix domain-containing protein [Rubrivirga sp. S365]
MRVLFDPETDMVVVSLVPVPYDAGGAEDTSDPDVVLHYTGDGRLAEVEVARASSRLDLTALRRSPAFEEVHRELDVRAIREGLGLSQDRFAAYLDVSVGTIRNWEQGRRTPRGPARRLLELSRDRPGMLFDRPQATSEAPAPPATPETGGATA